MHYWLPCSYFCYCFAIFVDVYDGFLRNLRGYTCFFFLFRSFFFFSAFSVTFLSTLVYIFLLLFFFQKLSLCVFIFLRRRILISVLGSSTKDPEQEVGCEFKYCYIIVRIKKKKKKIGKKYIAYTFVSTLLHLFTYF